MKVSGERSHETAWAHFCDGAALAAAGQQSQAEEEQRACLIASCYRQMARIRNHVLASLRVPERKAAHKD